MRKRRKTCNTRRRATGLLFVAGENNCENDGDDGKDEDYEEEADPPLFSGGASRDNSLVCVDNSGRQTLEIVERSGMCSIPCLHVFFDIPRGRFYVVYDFALLFYHDAHLHKGAVQCHASRHPRSTYIIEELRKLCNSLFDALDILMPFLHLSVCSS